MSVLKEQVGGSHYKDLVIQPVELYAATQCNAFQANIWKYMARYPYKKGKEDIEKAKHYASLAQELLVDSKDGLARLNSDCRALPLCAQQLVDYFCRANRFNVRQTKAIKAAAKGDYSSVITECILLIEEEYGEGANKS
jgi:hypothetical protein